MSTINPHQLTDNVKLLQKVALWKGDEVLIIKKSADSVSRPERWDLPGGNSEWPDASQAGFGQYAQDIAREVLEETNIQISNSKFLISKLIFFNTFFDPDKNVFSILVGWSINLPKNFDKKQIKLSHEHTDFKFVKLEDLDKYDYGYKKGKFITDIIRASHG